MSPSEARDVINGLMLASWVASGQAANRVVWDDLPGATPGGEQPWARVTIRHGEAPTRAFGQGSALYANTGFVTVQVFTPLGNANVSAYNIAFALVKAYRTAKNEGVSFRNARLKEVGSSGAFEQTNVLTDFSYDD
jgi:hypothetical protein